MSAKNPSCSSPSLDPVSGDDKIFNNQKVITVESDSESHTSPSSSEPAQERTTSITSHLSTDNPSTSESWRTSDKCIDDKCLLRSVWNSVQALNNNRLNARGFTRVNPETGHNDDLSLNVAPCDDSEVVTLKPNGANGEPAWFYLHGYIFTELFMKLPFSSFICDVLTFLNVAPCQLLPNAWGFIRCFELLCEQLNVVPTYPLFFFFYKTSIAKPSCVSFVPLSARPNMSIFKPLKSNFKHWQKKFFKIVYSPDIPNLTLDQKDRPLFPLHWTVNPRRDITVVLEALTKEEREVAFYILTLPQISCSDLLQAAKDEKLPQFFCKSGFIMHAL